MGGWQRLALVSPDEAAPSRTVGVSASVNLPLHHKVQKFSSGTGSPGWSRKNGRKTTVCLVVYSMLHVQLSGPTIFTHNIPQGFLWSTRTSYTLGFVIHAFFIH